ncbi:hypothetical protein GCM10009818_12780 [Nakamurella flavida]
MLFLILGGVLIGPHVLGTTESSSIQLISGLGLRFLFLLAGYELDPRLLRQRAGGQAVASWVVSAVLAVRWWGCWPPPASSAPSSPSPSR